MNLMNDCSDYVLKNICNIIANIGRSRLTERCPMNKDVVENISENVAWRCVELSDPFMPMIIHTFPRQATKVRTCILHHSPFFSQIICIKQNHSIDLYRFVLIFKEPIERGKYRVFVITNNSWCWKCICVCAWKLRASCICSRPWPCNAACVSVYGVLAALLATRRGFLLNTPRNNSFSSSFLITTETYIDHIPKNPSIERSHPKIFRFDIIDTILNRLEDTSSFICKYKELSL